VPGHCASSDALKPADGADGCRSCLAQRANWSIRPPVIFLWSKGEGSQAFFLVTKITVSLDEIGLCSGSPSSPADEAAGAADSGGKRMTRFSFHLVRSMIPALLALMLSAAALTGLTAPAAATPESDCFNFVQGNIPWNQSGAATWNPANIQSLCQGTAKSAEPGRCFDRVMSGGINWGGGTVWEWKNAIALCKGTNDANATVACFQGKIAGGQNWQQAIAACKS
jgi:hypothetical protein